MTRPVSPSLLLPHYNECKWLSTAIRTGYRETVRQCLCNAATKKCNDIITGSGHYSPLHCMVTNLGMEFIPPGATKWNIYISDTLLLTWEWVLAALIRINWRGIWVGEGKHCANKQIIYGPLLSSSFEYVQCKWTSPLKKEFPWLTDWVPILRKGFQIFAQKLHPKVCSEMHTNCRIMVTK